MDTLKTLEELKAEASALGITFRDNIGADKLAKKIEDHYVALETADAVQEIPEAPVVDEVDHSDKKTEVKGPVGTLSKVQKLRNQVAEAKKKAMAKRVVTISSNDKRESEYATTAYLSMENQHFGIARLIPLDIPIELENCLIEVARTTEITLHKDEIIDGRRTGNKIPVRVRKFNISFDDVR